MQKRKLKIILLSGFIILTFFLFLSNDVRAGANDLEYVFDTMNVINEYNPTFDNVQNARNQTVNTGIFYGLYSFTGENLSNTGTEISYIDVFTGDGDVNLTQTYDGHDMVLNCTITSGEVITAEHLDFWHYGTVEYWMQTTDATYQTQMTFKNGATTFLALKIDANKFQYWTGTWWDLGINAVDNVWYHVSIDFECTTGGWDGLAQYKYNIEINGEEFGDYDFGSNEDSMTRMITTIGGAGDYSTFFDAFHFTTFDQQEAEAMCSTVNFDSGTQQNSITNANYLDGSDWEILSQDLGGVHAIDFQITGTNGSIYGNPTLTISYDILMSANPASDTLHLQVEDQVGDWNSTTGLWLYHINESVGSISDTADDPIEISILQFGQPQFTMYIDVLKFRYTNYIFQGEIRGENIRQSVTETALSEPDADSFYFKEDGSANSPGNYDIPFWDETSGTPVSSPHWATDGLSCFMPCFSTLHQTIEKNITVNYGEIRVKFKVGAYAWVNNGFLHEYNFNIYGTDEVTLIARLSLRGTTSGDWTVYNGVTYDTLYTNFQSETDTFEVLLINETVVIDSNTMSTTVIVPKLSNEEGIGRVEVDCFASGGASGMNLYIDDIGIYRDGISLTQDLASYQIYGVDWDLNLPCYVYVNGTGAFSITYRTVTPLLFTVLPSRLYTGEYRARIEYIYWNNETNGRLFFNSNGTFSLTQIHIYRQWAEESGVEYYPEFTNSGNNLTDSYFRVIGTRLYYYLTVDDNDPEWIQYNFNIPDITAENRSFSFASDINGESLGFGSVYYNDATVTNLEIPYYGTTQSLVLPQTKVIANLTILITDNDLDDSDFTNGYITNMKLLYFPDLVSTVVTLNLIAVMIPIIIILFPSLAVSKQLGKMSFVPMMLLMTLICFATGLIPTWLFFVLAICFGAFIFMQRRFKEDE